MKTLKRVLVLSVVALATVAALSVNAQASERRAEYSARASHHGHIRVHHGPRAHRFYRRGHGFYRGGHPVRRHARRRHNYYPGYVGRRSDYRFFYHSDGNRIKLFGNRCF